MPRKGHIDLFVDAELTMDDSNNKVLIVDPTGHRWMVIGKEDVDSQRIKDLFYKLDGRELRVLITNGIPQMVTINDRKNTRLLDDLIDYVEAYL